MGDIDWIYHVWYIMYSDLFVKVPLLKLDLDSFINKNWSRESIGRTFSSKLRKHSYCLSMVATFQNIWKSDVESIIPNLGLILLVLAARCFYVATKRKIALFLTMKLMQHLWYILLTTTSIKNESFLKNINKS